jgi:hypothetical protein
MPRPPVGTAGRDAGRAIVRLWFAETGLPDATLDTFISTLDTGFKALIAQLNKGHFVLTDWVPFRGTTDADEVDYLNAEAFTFAGFGEGMDVVYIESNFFVDNAGNILPGQANWTRIIVHELTHLVCDTVDVPAGGRGALRAFRHWPARCLSGLGLHSQRRQLGLLCGRLCRRADHRPTQQRLGQTMKLAAPALVLAVLVASLSWSNGAQENPTMNKKLPPGASRPAPPRVDPIEHEGVRYQQDMDAQYHGGDQPGGYLVAVDPASGARLWMVKVYHIAAPTRPGLPAMGRYFRRMSLLPDGKHVEVENEVGAQPASACRAALMPS